jgi:hypothetical protein
VRKRAPFLHARGRSADATPLASSMAQFMRLVVCIEEKRIVEQPAVVANHFLKQRSQKTAPSASSATIP